MVPPLILGVIGRDVRRRMMEYLTGEPVIRIMVTVIHITARNIHPSPESYYCPVRDVNAR